MPVRGPCSWFASGSTRASCAVSANPIPPRPAARWLLKRLGMTVTQLLCRREAREKLLPMTDLLEPAQATADQGEP
jgi:hypothetical protein